MGEAKTRLEKLKVDHPHCCFCGGTRQTETIEHAPPKVFFRDKKRLAGLEFPACKRCNNGSGRLDQVAALICITMSETERPLENKEYFHKLLGEVKNNDPEVLRYIDNAAATTFLKIRGLRRPMVQTRCDPRLMTDYLNPWAAKQAIAFWYQHTRRTFTNEQYVYVKWLTNGQILRAGIPDEVFRLAENYAELRQGAQRSSDQFFYRYSINLAENVGYFVLGAQASSVAVMFIAPKLDAERFEADEVNWQKFETDEERGIHDAAQVVREP